MIPLIILLLGGVAAAYAISAKDAFEDDEVEMDLRLGLKELTHPTIDFLSSAKEKFPTYEFERDSSKWDSYRSTINNEEYHTLETFENFKKSLDFEEAKHPYEDLDDYEYDDYENEYKYDEPDYVDYEYEDYSYEYAPRRIASSFEAQPDDVLDEAIKKLIKS